MTLSADIRIGRWALQIKAPASFGVSLFRDEAFQSKLAAAVLGPGFTHFNSDDETIFVYDRIVAPLLEFASDDPGNALGLHASTFKSVLQKASPILSFANRRAAIFAYASAVAKDERQLDWAWQLLNFVPAHEENQRSFRVRCNSALALLSQLGDEAWPLVHALLETGFLRILLLTASHQALDQLATGMALPPLPSQANSPSGQLCAAEASLIIERLSPGMLSLVFENDTVRAAFAARLACCVCGATWFPPKVLKRFAAGALYGFAQGMAASVGQTTTAEPHPAASSSILDVPLVHKEPIQENAKQQREAVKSGWWDSSNRSPTKQNPIGRSALSSDGQATKKLLQLPVNPDVTTGNTAKSPVSTASLATQNLPPCFESATTSGGLLFVLPLLQEADFFELVRKRPLARLGLTGTLVALAVHGFGVHAGDAAVRAFSGLWPGRTRGDQDLSMPLPVPFLGSAARRAIHALVEAIEQALRTRSNGALSLALLLPRRAGLRFGKAEVDITFPANNVSIDVRRCGLDFSPGFIPWLGMIVRVHYA